ncbi:MAG: polysaccharide deacetylase family protein [Candidatus Cloacimonadales bacterium]|nr:polysaccharide deacetylase family protein [Candidatus Cloacimonadales bacterium]
MRFPKIIFGIKIRQKAICLTFDDGPHPVYTPQILQMLAKHDMKATFFITGSKIQKYRKILEQMISEGHEVGNHGYSHRNLIFKSKEFILNEINKTDELLRECGAKGEIVFRPPYGRMSLKAIFLLGELNKKIIMWNIPTKDYKAENSQSIIRKIRKKLKPGGIIILHDAGKLINSNVDRTFTIEAVELIIEEILQKGYSFKTISEMLKN